jgi:hypothetical protein
MDPATITTAVIAVLAPYAKKGAEAILHAAGDVGLAQTKKLLNTLKQRWAGDKEASEVLTNFEKKPERYQAALEDVLQEKVEQDPDLAAELDKQVNEMGPVLTVVQDMDEGEGVTGIKAKTIRSGKAGVEQRIKKGKNIVGQEYDTIGESERPPARGGTT